MSERKQEREEASNTTQEKAAAAKSRKTRVKQSDVPAFSLDEALRVPTAIAENYAFGPTSPVDVAAAMDVMPSSSTFRMLTGAAIAYGLVAGGAQSAQIEPTELARRILKPTEEGDDLAAKREAFLRPRVIGEFLSKYDGNRVPNPNIAANVLESMGVPKDSVEETLDLILEGAESTSMLRIIKGAKYVQLHGAPIQASQEAGPTDDISALDEGEAAPVAARVPVGAGGGIGPHRSPVFKANSRRVYVTHGKNKAFVGPLKELLNFGEMEAVVSVERESVSLPVPEKVLEDMRSCSAAIIHVENERKLLETDGTPTSLLNENVLIEIGASMALYGKRFILLVKEGVSLPSNLQGLYEVRYTGENLDADATIRLLKAITDIKQRGLPDGSA